MELAANSTITHAWKKLSDTHIYVLCKAHRSLPALRSTRQQFNMTLGDYCIQGNHQQNAQKCKSVVLKRPWKAPPFLWYKSWNRKAKYNLFWPKLGTKCAWGDSDISPSRICLQMTKKAPQVLIWGLQITFIE